LLVWRLLSIPATDPDDKHPNEEKDKWLSVCGISYDIHATNGKCRFVELIRHWYLSNLRACDGYVESSIQA